MLQFHTIKTVKSRPGLGFGLKKLLQECCLWHSAHSQGPIVAITDYETSAGLISECLLARLFVGLVPTADDGVAHVVAGDAALAVTALETCSGTLCNMKETR